MERVRFTKLPQRIQHVLEEIGSVADGQGLSAWLVGGMIRDLLLGRPSLDIDVVVEGDAIVFARFLADHFKARILAHKQFGTAVLTLPDGLRVDVVTARRESYARPGVLPDVIPGQIPDDLFRRDFTINAIAVSLNSSDAGLVRDDFNGRYDLGKGLIRIMHYRSFVDDPTRILRAVRYEKRFGFCCEQRTLAVIKMACQEDAFQFISPARYFHEFRRILEEDDPLAVLRRLRFLDGIRFFTFGHGEEKLLAKIVRLQAATLSVQGERESRWIPRCAGLLSFCDDVKARELMTAFNLSRQDKQKIEQFLHFLKVPDIAARLRSRRKLWPGRKNRSGS